VKSKDHILYQGIISVTRIINISTIDLACNRQKIIFYNEPGGKPLGNARLGLMLLDVVSWTQNVTGKKNYILVAGKRQKSAISGQLNIPGQIQDKS